MKPDSKAADAVRPSFGRALELYEELTKRLIETVNAIDVKDRNTATLKEEIELVKNFQKILLMVFDFESQLFKRGGSGSSDGRGALDLDGARAEIGRRLARLEAAGDPG